MTGTCCSGTVTRRRRRRLSPRMSGSRLDLGKALRYGSLLLSSTQTSIRRRTPMPVSFQDIMLAFQFVSGGGTGEHQAFLCKPSGKIYWHSELAGDVEELPDDIEESDKYVEIPDKRELDLGKPLALDFAREFLPRRLRQSPANFQQPRRLRQIQGSAGAQTRARSVVRFRGESRGKRVAGVVRAQFNRARRLISASPVRSNAPALPMSGRLSHLW